jgi:hypothetical protein
MAVPFLATLVLVGVLHVHHGPSHDSDAPFSEVLAAAFAARLDFVVLTQHAGDQDASGPLPSHEHAGLYARPDGGSLRVLVGVELGTADGHLLAYDLPELVPAEGRPGADVIRDIHARGGFAVVPHPLTYGGWRDLDAPFDGIEVHNHAAEFRALLGPLLPLRLLRFAVDRPGLLRAMLGRPDRELALWDDLLARGRRVLAFSGSDAHRNVALLGWQLDPYLQQFSSVHTHCPVESTDEAAIWRALRDGSCWIRYAIFDGDAAPREVTFPSGRRELQLPGDRVLEIRQPPSAPGARTHRYTAQPWP